MQTRSGFGGLYVLMALLAGCGSAPSPGPGSGGPGAGHIVDGSVVSKGEIQADSAGPVNQAGTVTFTVTFDHPMGGLADMDAAVQLAHSGTAGGQVTVMPVDDRSCRLAVTGVTGDGTYALSLPPGAARDTHGNPSPSVTSEEVLVDNTPPSVSANATASQDGSPALAGTVNEPTVGVQVRVGGGTYAATIHADGTWSVSAGTIQPALPPGAYDVGLTATDVAGNVGEHTAVKGLLIDVTPPIVAVQSLTTNKRRPRLTGTVNDPTATVTARIGALSLGTGVNPGDGTWVLDSQADVPDGTHIVVVTARDPAGNSSDAAGTLVLDATAPRVTVDNLWTADTAPPLSGTLDDPAATISVTVAGRTYAVQVSPGRWSLAGGMIDPPLAAGWYDVVVRAVDGFGNVGTDATSKDLRVTDPPVIYNAQLAADNSYMDLWFDQPVYGNAARTQPIGPGNLLLRYTASNDPVTAVTIQSLSNAEGGSLLGVEHLRVHLALTGGPTTGLGVVSIQAATNALWNGQNQVAVRAASGDFRLRDPRNLLTLYDRSFDKFLDNSPTISWRVANATGVLDPAHSGARSALLADPTGVFTDRSITMPNDTIATEFVAVLPQGRYRVSAWVYVKANTVGQPGDTQIRLGLKSGRISGIPLDDFAPVAVTTMNTWQMLEGTFLVPADASGKAWMVVQARDGVANDSDVYVDDMRVEVVP